MKGLTFRDDEKSECHISGNYIESIILSQNKRNWLISQFLLGSFKPFALDK